MSELFNDVLSFYLVVYLVLVVPVFIWVYRDSLWGWSGLFFYHKEELEGHMFCHLGWRYTYRVFGIKFVRDTNV